MKKLLLIGGVVAILAFVGIAVARKSQNQPAAPSTDTENTAAATSTAPTIQVLRGTAYLVNDVGTQERELKDGDEIIVPATIQVATSGLANINFADGSMARIDGGSMLALKQATYDATSGKANTSMFLSVGKIWSKVIDLATPDSSWEVETSNAVATVRGTAFSSLVSGKKATFTGSEHTIAVSPVDPATKQKLADAEVLVAEDKEVEISSDQLANILSRKEKLAAISHKTNAALDSWIHQNENQDIVVNEALKELKTQFRSELLNGDRLPPRFRERLREKMREKLREFYEEHKEELLLSREATSTTATSTTRTVTSTTPTATTTKPVDAPKPVSLALVRTAPTTLPDPFPEDGRITGKAILTLSDGTKVDVTSKATWKVLGPIGSIVTPGTFVAKLDASVAEFGKSSGAIVVTFTSPAGQDFLAQTPIFTVAASFMNSSTTDIGGQ